MAGSRSADKAGGSAVATEPSGLGSRLSALEQSATQPKEHVITRLLRSLPEQDARTLERLLANEAVSIQSIWQALRDSGIHTSRESLRSYRRDHLA